MKQAVCVLIENPLTGKVLCVSRRDNLKDWGLPGGKVEEGELNRVAAARELYEETGLDLHPDSLMKVFEDVCYGAVTYNTTTYLVNPSNQLLNYKFVSSSEGTVSWREWDDLLSNESSFSDYNWRLLREMNRRTLVEDS